MNFAVDVVEAAAPDALALVELSRDGARREHTFGAMAAAAARMAARLHGHGVRRGDVVMTLVGNQPDWVAAMVACFRQGYVVLPCTEQLRAKDLALRLAATAPAAVVADGRNEAVLREAGWDGPTVWGPGVMDWPEPGTPAPAPAPAELTAADPCLITFTSGTSGAPKAVLHAQRYLTGQHVQAEHWLDARPGDLVWCTAASGWSKSARNVFIAPWIRGAAALLHDARFDPAERLDLLERERVNVLCMAPTEYRVIAKRATLRAFEDLRGLVAAGEALNPEVLHAWHRATGLHIRDGYGQTETGQLTGAPLGEPVRPGSMGRPLPGVRLWIDDGELVADPATVPTFFVGYLGDETPLPEVWRTGDRVHADEDGWLFFEGRTDDVIISSGYRIGPFEVESALVSHPAVAEAAVVAAPDDERGSVVRAVVVLRDGVAATEALAAELQAHVKDQTAPYKYPRIVDFADELPKTTSGKVRRALLRDGRA
ncbi:AMP-binding protein [Paraconexibacter antarcticus]|uniref:AMP-binding protein n=1 Tax=Paraconexibacter antarcticus TaxID=2949664 RepID=A0ABY5DZH5_9ACTN|nr:AMP-binding protein [Paraconexibacter antarcticus]UTI66616.1 AMP-binding protein [Paraconexibacter antarcticus]